MLLFTVKAKLKALLGAGVPEAYSAESPPPSLIAKFGRPPTVYSADINLWMLEAAIGLLSKRSYDLVFLITTDYIPHMYAPDEEPAKDYMERIDGLIGMLHEISFVIGIVADHGMSRKTLKVNPKAVLERQGIKALMIPLIKDQYVKHHRNLGGAAYIYLHDRRALKRAVATLSEIEGVEFVLSREEAAARFKLPPHRIGDIVLLGDKRTVFGDSGRGIYECVDLRSHGSLHEVKVPLLMSERYYEAPYGKVLNKDALIMLIRAAFAKMREGGFVP